jgi:hypothetical protein
MHIDIIKDKKFEITTFLIFFSFFFQSIIEVNDSLSYIENSYKRPFLYPLIINIFEFIFSDYFKRPLIIFQLLLGYFGLTYFLKFFFKKFKIKSFIFKVILFFSISYPYFNLSMKIGNSILSESLAYPIFLIFTIFFIKSIFGNKNYFKNFLLSLIFFSLLVLIKKTFLILVPVYFLSLIVELIFSKELKKAIISILLVFFTFFSLSLIEKGATFIKYGTFSTISVSGSSLVSGPFYLAKNDDFKKIKGDLNKKIINNALKILKENNIERIKRNHNSNNDILSFVKDTRRIFHDYFNKYVFIQSIFEDNIENVFTKKDLQNYKYKNISSQHTTDIAIQLIKLNPVENLYFYITNVIYGMGGYFISNNELNGYYANIGFSGLFILIFQILIFIISLTALFQKTKHKLLAKICLLFILINFTNISAVAMYQPVYDRFSFFSFQLIFFISSFVLIKFFEDK